MQIKVIVLNNISASNWEELFDKVASYLYTENMVKDGYKEFLVKREKEFPTGFLFNENFALALPHADIKYSQAQAVVLVRPAKPVEFKRADDSSKTVNANIIVFLIIKDEKAYTKFLSQLVALFQNEEVQQEALKGNLGFIKERVEEIAAKI